MAKLKLTPKDFAPHVLAVIGDLTDHDPGQAVSMEHTYGPVCERMGVDADSYGVAAGKNIPVVHRKIQLAWRQLRDKGLAANPSRGQWALTRQGLDELREASPEDATDEEAPESETPVVAARATMSETDDVDDGPVEETSNVVRIKTKEGRHPYSDDPYVRGLAIERVPCFGAFSSRSNVCKTCRLSSDCVAAVEGRKAEIAAEMLREEAEERQAEEARQAKKARQDASIDELIAATEDGSAAKKGGRKGGSQGRYELAPGETWADAFAQRETGCAQCGEWLEEQQACYWIELRGIFHPECIDLKSAKT